MNFFDVWCFAAGVSFGYVEITDEQKALIPQVPDTSCEDQGAPVDNCEVLAPGFHVSWSISGDQLRVKLQAQIGDDDYMSFGISGSTTSSFMEGADVAVAFYDSTPQAVDYFLQRGYAFTFFFFFFVSHHGR